MRLFAFVICLLLPSLASAQTVSVVQAIPTRPTTVVASLPACSTATRGMMYMVTDALTPVAIATVTGGGAVIVGVICNGSAWIVQ